MKQLFFFAVLLFAFAVNVYADGVKKEAESGKYSKCDIVSDNKFSGKKAVRMTDGEARLTLSIDMETKGKYAVYVAGEGIGGEKVVNCAVNGANFQMRMNQYKEYEVGTFIFHSGGNEVVITPNWTWFNIDYVRIERRESTVTFDVAAAPVDRDATPAARELYAFLYDNFGKKTISGMMLGDMSSYNGNVLQHADIKAVYNASGKYPALVGMDFMNATGKSEGNSWNKDYTRASVNLAKDTYKRGGIPAFTWHWRDPSRKTDAFYSDQATTMKISSALKQDGTWNTSSALYKYIIKDINAIANYFLELQRENMACIFRPLHEANGTWFWWGNDGAENFRKLFRLVYDQMVTVKGVHNVIWVWNADPNAMDWNPGAEYYDIVSADIYNESFDYSSNYIAFDKLKEQTAGKKILALSENGPIPDIQQEVDDDAVWSWWMPWYQTWDGGFVDKTSREEWKKCMTDSRVITLGDMPGWKAATDIIQVEKEETGSSLMFDLKGVPTSSVLKRGIYIIGNRKVLVK